VRDATIATLRCLALALVCVPSYAGDDKGGDDDTGESATPAKEAPPPTPQYDLQDGCGEAVFVSVRIYRNLDGRIAGVVSVESHPARKGTPFVDNQRMRRLLGVAGAEKTFPIARHCRMLQKPQGRRMQAGQHVGLVAFR
jgi:hypothetical protein